MKVILIIAVLISVVASDRQGLLVDLRDCLEMAWWFVGAMCEMIMWTFANLKQAGLRQNASQRSILS